MPRDVLFATVAGSTAVVAGVGALLLGLPALALVASVGAAVAVVVLVRTDRHLGERQVEVDVLRGRLEESEQALKEMRLAYEDANVALGEAERLTTQAMADADGVPEPLLDPETGLLGEQYFNAAVTDRLAAARRHLRPVTVVLADVSPAGGSERAIQPSDPATIASILQRTLRESDTTCRLDDGRFAIILEDTADTSAVWAVERIRRAVQLEMPSTVRAGIASYPTHGLSAGDVVAHADHALTQAREMGHDGIQVARAD